MGACGMEQLLKQLLLKEGYVNNSIFPYVFIKNLKLDLQ